MWSRPLMPLLFCQTLCLSGVLGASARLWPPSLLFMSVLLWIDHRSRDTMRLLALLIAFFLGYGYAAFCTENAPALPEWMHERRAVSLEGDVLSVSGLYEGRTRIVLEHLSANGQPLSGKLTWTWEHPPQRPTAGTRIAATLKVLPVGGFRNRGVSESGSGWRQQGIFWRAWSKGHLASFRTIGEASHQRLYTLGAQLRESWRQALENRLKTLYLYQGENVSPKAIQESASNDGWGFLPALLFGDRSRLSIHDAELLTKAGLVHSIALSGQHLSIAALIAGCCLWLVGRLYPTCFLALPRPKLTLLLSLVPALAYLWLGNAPPSLCRAALMLVFWSVFCLNNRPTAFPDAMLAALVIMELADPAALGNVGTLLSFSSLAGIALASPLLTSLWTPPSRMPVQGFWTSITWHIRKVLVSLIVCSVAVQLFTLPIVLSIFGRLPLFFAINILWLPVLGFLILPAAFLGLLTMNAGMDMLADPLFMLAATPCAWLVNILAWLDEAGWLRALWLPRPHWTTSIGWILLVLCLSWRVGRTPPFPARWKHLVLLAALLLVCGPVLWAWKGCGNTLHLRVLDVGQGQAVLLEGPGHTRMLVDGGGFNSSRFDTGRDILRPVLMDNAPLALDVMALTHADTDHLRGLLFLARHARIKQAVLPGEVDTPSPRLRELESILRQRSIPIHYARHGDRLHLEQGLCLEIFAFDARSRTNSNNQGIGFRLTHAGHGLVVIPGDANKAALKRLVQDGVPLSADVLVAPHHGAASSVQASFIDAVSPREVLISCGLFNRYAFPSSGLCNLLTAKNIPFRTTAAHGELDVSWSLSQRTAKTTKNGVANGEVLR